MGWGVGKCFPLNRIRGEEKIFDAAIAKLLWSLVVVPFFVITLHKF